MALNFFETVHFKLRALTGKNPGHEIGTGFGDLAEDVDNAMHNAGLVAGGTLVRQEPSTVQGYLSWGLVTSAGVNTIGSDEYTVHKVEAGKYEIKWEPTNKTVAEYAVVVTPNGVAELTVEVSAMSKTGFTVTFLKGAVLTSSGFSFIVLASA